MNAKPVVLTRITITEPTKKTYIEGETLNLSGMTVTAWYSDGTSAGITSLAITNPANSAVLNTVGTITVSVSYGGFSDSFIVAVNTKTLEGITLSALPTKRVYIQGDTLNLTGMVVTAAYNNGSSANVTAIAASNLSNGSVLNTVGTVTVMVSYGGFDASFTITVNEKPTRQTDAEFLQERAAVIIKNGLKDENLRLVGKTLTLVIDGREFVLSTNANNRNISGEIFLGGGYWLAFDLKGNGANIKDFRIIMR